MKKLLFHYYNLTWPNYNLTWPNFNLTWPNLTKPNLCLLAPNPAGASTHPSLKYAGLYYVFQSWVRLSEVGLG